LRWCTAVFQFRFSPHGRGGIRLGNGFSKTIEGRIAMVAIRGVHYNLARTHKTIAPAMQLGYPTRFLGEIVLLAD
jgi:hypothetical protein